MENLGNDRRTVASQDRANAFVQVRKRDFIIFFAGQYEQRRLIFLPAAFGSFLRKLCYEDDRTHVWRIAIRINRHGWWQKCAKRITALVASAGAW